MLKFIYSEKATKFCETSTVDLSYVVPIKSTVEISQNFVAFSEYMNFNKLEKGYQNKSWWFFSLAVLRWDEYKNTFQNLAPFKQ